MITAAPSAHSSSVLKRLKQTLVILLACAAIAGCTPKQEPTESSQPPEAIDIPSAALGNATSNAWLQASQSATEAEEKLLILQSAVQQLLQTPSEEALAEAREHWHQTHDALLQLQPLFTLGNLNPGLFKQLQQAQWQLDAWPIEPGYLDYFDVYTHSGIVNDIALPINAQAIRQQHGFSSDADVVVGMHAIAYLLWGEQQQRPASDFLSRPANPIERKNGLEAADLPPQRRSALLSLQVSLLQDDLKSLGYRLNHDASGINVSYFSLPPQSQLQLWQGVISDVLNRQIQTELIAPLKLHTESQTKEKGQSSTLASAQTHQQFSGRPLSTISTLVRSIENLVTAEPDKPPHENLAYWLNRDIDNQLLQTQLQQLHANVTALEDAREPSLEQLEELERQVQALALVLAATP